MCNTFGNCNSCTWVILLVIILLVCNGNNGECGNFNNGCGCGCN